MIRLEQISFAYGKKVVLSDFDLHIASGERLFLSAPSGGGKTTVLRLLMGLEKPQKGQIIKKEGLQYSAVFQEDRLIASATVAENIRIFAPQAAVTSLLCALGLDGLEDRLPKALSGGQRRRVALARALAHPCDLLVLDEPFTGLDAEAKAKCVQAIKANCPTMILASHDHEDAAALGLKRINVL